MAIAVGRPVRSHPEWWIYALAGVAWIVVLATGPGGGHAHHGGTSWGSTFASWTVMVVAMMAPFAAPGARWAALSGLRRLRGRAPVWYVAGFAAVWTAFAAGAATVQTELSLTSPWAVVAAAAGAAVWQSMRRRQWALDGCGRSSPIPARGWRCVAGTTRAGAKHGLWCIATCWAAMLIMIPLHHPLAMAGLFAVQAHERRPGPNPFAIRRWQPGALVYAALALGGVAAAVL